MEVLRALHVGCPSLQATETGKAREIVSLGASLIIMVNGVRIHLKVSRDAKYMGHIAFHGLVSRP